VEKRGSVVEEDSSYKLPYLRKYIKKFSSPLYSTFSLYTTSKGCQVERPAPQGRAMAFERFSPQLIISGVKRALKVALAKVTTSLL
jgi:hypothetical protein